MKYSTLAALVGTTSAGFNLGHKAEMSPLHKSFKQQMNKVKSAELMELQSDSFFGSSGY